MATRARSEGFAFAVTFWTLSTLHIIAAVWWAITLLFVPALLWLWLAFKARRLGLHFQREWLQCRQARLDNTHRLT